MQIYGRGSASELVGDLVVFRNLQPQDVRIPSLETLRPALGLPAGLVPRKHEPVYARVVVAMLQAARQLEAPNQPIERLVFVGDTRLSDGTAFMNLCASGGWRGMAFIAAENSQPLVVEVSHLGPEAWLYTANRWGTIEDFDAICRDQGFAIDAGTAVVLDIDKTLIGARGRNAGVIDQARVQAVEDTVAALLGDAYRPDEFRQAYDRLNQPEFHPFTEDNQDYLAYVCLVLGAGLYGLDALISEVKSGSLANFGTFIRRVEGDRASLPISLQEIHSSIYQFFLAGDPTPFKPFRRNEYLRTIARFGCLPDDTPLAELLKGEITLTQEVRRQALAWKSQGALLFALSDKPDEAALPTPELAAAGYPPLHRAVTHIIGL